jgi:hypothetical protein
MRLEAVRLVAKSGGKSGELVLEPSRGEETSPEEIE